MKETIFFIILLFLNQCKNQDFHIRTAKLKSGSQKKLILGSIENRDFKTAKSITKDFRELFAFELANKGYHLYFIETIISDVSKETDSERSSLPLSLQKSAGVSGIGVRHSERQLDKNEIKSINGAVPFDYFVQGVVSIHSNENIFDRKEYNYFFLNIYDSEGNLIGIVNSSFDDKMIAESDLLRDLAFNLAKSFEASLK